jgi:hypothetical protein
VIRYLRRAYRVAGISLGYAIGTAICEPQLRLGRRRHDGTCDHCGKDLGAYAMEKLDFPVSSAEASSTTEKLRAMADAKYVRICLECPEDAAEHNRSQNPSTDGGASA